MRRSELGYALLLSVPVGVGVAIAVYQTAGGFPANPLALGGGLATTVAVFALVVAGVRPGSDAPEPDPSDAPSESGSDVPSESGSDVPSESGSDAPAEGSSADPPQPDRRAGDGNR